MNILEPFAPTYGSGKTLTAGVASLTTSVHEDAKSICITNTGANIAYVRIGNSSSVATTADYPILAGDQAIITKTQGDNTLAYISAAGTTLHVMVGQGWK